ncbi:ty3-gypsy retroelement transposase [Cucumis melo var. makuwa]|uniref:Ty3-gypsy retroelement transposase n=1 Tax=Cucumis melo var. makuwa TaxID=1194695 RepID=A0A5D3DGS0_CUCMM|nr:ty3-gypsy retroelement transposase [Cucumis melo var. makuwa]
MCQLKKALGDHTKVNPLVPFVNENHEWMTQPEEVYGYQKNPATKEWEVLISWNDLPPHEATWEICTDFQQQFPDFHLEYRVALEEGSSVRPPIKFTYNRGDKGKKICEEVNEIEEERGNCSGGAQGYEREEIRW